MTFIKDEKGSTSVEMALLFPFIFALIMFVLYINMYYEGKIATSIGANEAIRYAVTQETLQDAQDIAEMRLKEVYAQHNISFQDDGWSLIKVSDNDGDNKYSIGDTIQLTVKTKKGMWCKYTYTLKARVEDDIYK